MPVFRFHLLTINHEMVEGGFTVTVTTNTPCHLYLRYSNVFPRIHRKSTVRRGLVMGWDARYCFTVYQHLEQNEEGDTSSHTFTWPGWVNCNTRYFYFWGTKGATEMVSDSPIFWLHYLWTALPEPDLLQHYFNSRTSAQTLQGNRIVAQTFTPLVGQQITKCSVFLAYYIHADTPTTATMLAEIRNTIDGWPTGSLIGQATFDVHEQPAPLTYYWIDFAIAAPGLLADTLYALTLRRLPQGDYWPLIFWGAARNNPYDRGACFASANWGVAWSGCPQEQDLFFKTYGYPA